MVLTLQDNLFEFILFQNPTWQDNLLKLVVFQIENYRENIQTYPHPLRKKTQMHLTMKLL